MKKVTSHDVAEDTTAHEVAAAEARQLENSHCIGPPDDDHEEQPGQPVVDPFECGPRRRLRGKTSARLPEEREPQPTQPPQPPLTQQLVFGSDAASTIPLAVAGPALVRAPSAASVGGRGRELSPRSVSAATPRPPQASSAHSRSRSPSQTQASERISEQRTPKGQRSQPNFKARPTKKEADEQKLKDGTVLLEQCRAEYDAESMWKLKFRYRDVKTMGERLGAFSNKTSMIMGDLRAQAVDLSKMLLDESSLVVPRFKVLDIIRGKPTDAVDGSLKEDMWNAFSIMPEQVKSNALSHLGAACVQKFRDPPQKT